MHEGGFLDLKNRPGKAGGGFCTSFPTVGVPFIFANFNGTHHDIGVFTHEMGHAFQNWESRDQPGVDYLWPTMEAAEIHSMGLEFLTYPEIGNLVGEDAADRFRRMHLIGALAFLPYGVCVDHFQHEVYAHPRCLAGGTARDVAAAGTDLHAVGRLRRSGISYQGRALAGEASHLRRRRSIISTTRWRSAARCSSGSFPGATMAALEAYVRFAAVAVRLRSRSWCGPPA